MIQEAFQTIQYVSSDYINHYLKRSWGALISFFYYSGLTYILSHDILKGTKLLEKCCSFFYRYKHFLSKSMQIDKYNKLVERATLLLTIFLSFNRVETEDTIIKVIAEKYQDKYSKLLKYDQIAFEETLTSGCCKIVKPLMTSASITEYLALDSVDLVPTFVNKLTTELNKYRILNGVESVLLVYSRLPIEKLSKILNHQVKEIEDYLTEYETIRQALPKETQFEKTFLSKFLTNLKTHSFAIKGRDIHVHKIDDPKGVVDSTIQDYIQELLDSETKLRKL